MQSNRNALSASHPLRAGGADPGEFLRTPPHNYEAERALLGGILMNNRALDRVAEFLRPEHFAAPEYGRLYEICTQLIEGGSVANPVTLKAYAEKDPLLSDAGGKALLAAVLAGAVTIINSEQYGRIIHALYQCRELIALGTDIAEQAYEAATPEAAAELAEEAETRLHDLTADKGQEWASDIEGSYDAAIKRWQAHDRGEISGLSRGLKDEDDHVGLLCEGDLEIWGARPGQLKTTKAKVEAYHVADNFRAAARATKTKPKWVVLFSAEMSDAQLADGYVTAFTGIPAPRQRRRHLTENDWAKVLAAKEQFAGLPIRVVTKPAPTLSFIRSVCRKMQRRGGVGLVIVDYIQIMGIERGIPHQDRNNQVGYLARGLKETAKLFSCPIIALSQLSRGVERREEKRPNMADLRDSGEIEAAADTIQLLYRPSYYVEQEKPVQRDNEDDSAYSARHAKWAARLEGAEGKLEVIVGKARFGEAGKTITLSADLARGWIENFSAREAA